MYELGLCQVDPAADGASENFVSAMRFLLGNPEMLALNAIAGDDGVVTEIHNSFRHPAYRRCNAVLRPGSRFVLSHRPGSSIVGVEATGDSVVCRDLSLTIWKDATIQFKLDARGD